MIQQIFDSILKIGERVYTLNDEELLARKEVIKKKIEEGEEDMELQIEALIITTRLLDEGKMDIGEIDNADNNKLKTFLK